MKRLIPKLQMKSIAIGNVTKLVLVTTKQFNNPIQIGDPVSQAKIYQAQLADELIFLNLDRDLTAREDLLKVINNTAEQVFMPITIGGGIRSLDDVKQFLDNGADKVSLNTAAIETPSLIDEMAAKFGSSTIVASLDYRKVNTTQCRVVSHCGKQLTTLDPVAWAQQCVSRGAGELLLTCVDRDGLSTGLDIEMIKEVVDTVTVPVVASGGCGQAKDFVETFIQTDVSGIAAGTYFCLRDQNPMQARAQISNSNINIRLQN